MATIITPNGYQTKAATISNSAVPITAAGWSWTAGYVALAEQCVITAHTNPICITWDGTTPTSTTGLYVGAFSSVTLKGNVNVCALQMIRAGSGDATVSITLEKF